MKYPAVIFDLDGTLLDTLADIADAMNASLEKMGFPGHPMAAYRYLTGDGMKAMAERSLPGTGIDSATVQLCIREFRSEYAHRWGTKTKPYPGIRQLLSSLGRRVVKVSVDVSDFIAARWAARHAHWRAQSVVYR